MTEFNIFWSEQSQLANEMVSDTNNSAFVQKGLNRNKGKSIRDPLQYSYAKGLLKCFDIRFFDSPIGFDDIPIVSASPMAMPLSAGLLPVKKDAPAHTPSAGGHSYTPCHTPSAGGHSYTP